MRAIRRLLLSLVVFGALAPLPACKNNGQPSQAPAVGPAIVTIDTAERKLPFHVELALTGEEQNRGLMFRQSLPDDGGMLFDYDPPQQISFWMKNTYIPLSIAFIAPDGHIVNIEDMKPQSEETHWSRGPAMYALEMKKGWFAERGIGPGAVVKGIPTRQ